MSLNENEKMLMLKAIDNVDYEHAGKEIQNLYCVICTTVEPKETWENHVKSHSHVEAAKRFDLLFEKSENKLRCQLCRCEVPWEHLKQHEESHFLIPWDNAEENYNKYEIFFENEILQWNDLFGCCLCELSFTAWSLAFIHITDTKHQSLKKESSKNFDSTLIKSANDLSFELLVKEGIFASDESRFECKICKSLTIPFSGILRHLKGLIHVCKKSKFLLKEPENDPGLEITQLFVPTQKEESEIQFAASNNCHKDNDTDNILHNVSPDNCVVQHSRNIPQRSYKPNFQDNKKENRCRSDRSMPESSRERHSRACDSFDSSLPKNDEICDHAFSSAALSRVTALVRNGDDSAFESKDIAVKVRRNSEASQNTPYCENIAIRKKNCYYCEICCLEMMELEDLHLHLKTRSHLNSLINSKKPETVKEEEKMLDANSTDFENDYTEIINDTNVLCVVCDVSLPSASLNVREHNQGKTHFRSLKKYGCENISRIDDDHFYCDSCYCTIPGRVRMHQHVKEEKHRSACTLDPVEKSFPEMDQDSEEQSFLHRPNPIGSKQGITSKLTSPLRKPKSIKPREEESFSVKKPSSPLREPNSIEPKETALPAKKLSIPLRKPTSTHSHEATIENKKTSNSLRKPNLLDSKNKLAQEQKLRDYSSRSETVDSKEGITEHSKFHLEPPETYTDNLLLGNNSLNENPPIAEDPHALEESFDFISVLSEEVVFCEICRCSLSPSPRNISAHVMGKHHSISLRDYGCDNIQRMHNSNYFCKRCNEIIPHTNELHRHINSPRHLYLVREEKKSKTKTPPKLNVEERTVEDKKNSLLVPKITKQTISLADVANRNYGDNIEENDSIALLANDIINRGGHDYFCNRCYCNISGIINMRRHVAGKKHQKK